MSGLKVMNEYAARVDDLYARTPKAVFAAVAVSLLTAGGEPGIDANAALLHEWKVLHENGIVPQAPPAVTA
jgi:hypothetical protein